VFYVVKYSVRHRGKLRSSTCLLPHNCLFFWGFCSVVACLLRKSNWWSKISPWSFIIMLILNNFSNSFNRTRSKLIGLYYFASSASFPGFWIIIICAIFHWDEKKPRLSTALYNWVIYFIAVSDSICNILLVMRSYPGAFFGFRCFITAFTSLIVKGLVRISCVAGIVSSESNPFSFCVISLWLGLKTLRGVLRRFLSFSPHFYPSSRPVSL